MSVCRFITLIRGNRVEQQSDNFVDWNVSTGWMRPFDQFAISPIGVFVVPSKMVVARRRQPPSRNCIGVLTLASCCQKSPSTSAFPWARSSFGCTRWPLEQSPPALPRGHRGWPSKLPWHNCWTLPRRKSVRLFETRTETHPLWCATYSRCRKWKLAKPESDL